jgi:hypothetical protein
MYHLLKITGLRYRNTNYGKTFLLERANVIPAPVKFSRTMHSLKDSSDECPLCYLDETWVNQNHSRKNIWQALGEVGHKVPPRKGSKII